MDHVGYGERKIFSQKLLSILVWLAKFLFLVPSIPTKKLKSLKESIKKYFTEAAAKLHSIELHSDFLNASYVVSKKSLSCVIHKIVNIIKFHYGTCGKDRQNVEISRFVKLSSSEDDEVCATNLVLI